MKNCSVYSGLVIYELKDIWYLKKRFCQCHILMNKVKIMCHYNDLLCYLSVFILNLKFLNKCCTVLIKLHWNIFSMSTNWRYLSKYFLLFVCIPLCIFIILSLSIFIHTTKILLVSLVWSAMYVYFHCKALVGFFAACFASFDQTKYVHDTYSHSMFQGVKEKIN